jgi:uncharacterized protein YxjI
MSDLLTAPQLVISQRAKLIELTNQYDIMDGSGAAIGYVQEEAQSSLRKVMRFATDFDQFLTHRLGVYDTAGHLVVALTRPRKVFKSRLVIDDADGRHIGTIVQRNVFGKINFDLLGAAEELLGQIQAENWRAWDFAIVDAVGQEVARIDKKFVGVLKATTTNADNYVVTIDDEVRGDFRLIVIAAATAVDSALKQDPGKVGVFDAVDLFT